MKKVNLLWALVLLLCLSSCKSEPKDAKECVMQFLQCLKDGDTEWGETLAPDVYNIAQTYNPYWESNDVVFEAEEDTLFGTEGLYKKGYIIGENSYEVNVHYKNDEAVFLVTEIEGKFRIVDFFHFLNYGTASTKNGVNLEQGICSDIMFVRKIGTADKVISCINTFNKNLANGKASFDLYPAAKSFGDYIVVDTGLPKIQSVTINDKEPNYVVECQRGKTFYVNLSALGTCTIVNSEGLYDFDKKISDLCKEYNYEYSPYHPQMDCEAVEVANQADKKIKQLVFQRERVEHWKKVGLVITRTWVARGTNNNNYPTSGLGVRIFNPTNKNIKYIVFHTIARNGVDDVIGRETCRGIGPIEPQEAGEYGFKTLFMDYNSIVSRVSVSSVEIIYTDGSRKTAKGSDVMATSENFDIDWW